MPVPGVLWQTLHYLLGCQRLGFEPYYVEANARTPSMLMQRETDDGSRSRRRADRRGHGRLRHVRAAGPITPCTTTAAATA